MRDYKHKHPLRCTKRFKEIINEIGQLAGFVHVKGAKDKAHKKGFSALLDEVAKTNRIEIEGDYKDYTTKLNQIRVNHANNITQLINTVGNNTVSKGGKTYQLLQYITAYYQSSEMALAYFEAMSTSQPYFPSVELELIEELVKEAAIKETDSYLTFKSSDETYMVLIRGNTQIEAIADLFRKSYICKRNFFKSAFDGKKIRIFNDVFSRINKLTLDMNMRILEKKPHDNEQIATELMTLKRLLDSTNEKENDN